ncbi:MAG: cysteine hydrolase, partial [Clostridia bacterium]|nr:cysteine hydrolase [Clostridia bacterium]
MKNKKKNFLTSGIKKTAFMFKAKRSLRSIYSQIDSLSPLEIDSLVVDNAALIIVDMINGFVKEGALSSPNVLAINERVADLAGKCEQLGIPVAALADCHTHSSPEFESYPIHCLSDSVESAVTDEIAQKCKYTRIEKNSTNGFLTKDFRDWMESVGTDTFILVGDCTDICVLQLATTMKAYFNEHNKFSRIVVPVNAVATYDLGVHDAGLCG